MPESMQGQIGNLLAKAAEEHHEYEVSVLNGVRDEEWDMWYASWLVEHGINTMLNSDMRSTDLASLLRDIHTLHQRSDQSETWSAFTAAQLIETAAG